MEWPCRSCGLPLVSPTNLYFRAAARTSYFWAELLPRCRSVRSSGRDAFYLARLHGGSRLSEVALRTNETCAWSEIVAAPVGDILKSETVLARYDCFRHRAVDSLV